MTTKQNKTESEVKSFLEKIVVNAGVGRLSGQPGFEDKILPQIISDLSAITGQKPQVRLSKKSIAGFKMREGQTVGLKITLRHQKMVDFYERLVKIVLPRVHDFRGVDTHSLDEGGTLHIGFREQFVFPELNAEESTYNFSLGLNIVPKEKDRAEAEKKFRALGMPFKK